MTDLKPDLCADTRGLRCPLPVLRARKLLLGMAPGQVLDLIADDPMALIDLPHFCTEAGHRLLAQEPDGSATRFVIRCGDPRS